MLEGAIVPDRFAVAQDGPLELGPFHWQPSSRFRVRLTPLAAPGAAT